MNATLYLDFTAEETELLGYYEVGNGRLHVLAQLRQALPYITEDVSAGMAADLIDKLENMNDEQYGRAVILLRTQPSHGLRRPEDSNFGQSSAV